MKYEIAACKEIAEKLEAINQDRAALCDYIKNAHEVEVICDLWNGYKSCKISVILEGLYFCIDTNAAVVQSFSLGGWRISCETCAAIDGIVEELYDMRLHH